GPSQWLCGSGFSQSTCLPCLSASMVANACVCSQVLTTTASKEPGWSKSLRKSVNFFAPGCFAPAASSALALTSQSATMFSEATPARLAAPRPPTPMTARLSLLRRAPPRRKAGAANVVPAAARKVRRVIRRRVMAVLSHWGRTRVDGWSHVQVQDSLGQVRQAYCTFRPAHVTTTPSQRGQTLKPGHQRRPPFGDSVPTEVIYFNQEILNQSGKGLVDETARVSGVGRRRDEPGCGIFYGGTRS